MIKIKYILGNFLRLFLIVSICFILLFFIIQIIEDLPDIIKLKKEFDIMFYIFQIPAIFVQTSPVITFICGMLLLVEMMKYNEIKVLEISGITPLKIFNILIVSGVVISLLALYVENTLSVKYARKLKSSESQKMIFFSSPHYFFYAEKFVKPSYFKNVEISILQERKIFSIKGEEGKYEGEDIWELKNGNFWIFDKEGELKATGKFKIKRIEFPLTPEILLTGTVNPETLTLREIKKIIKRLKKMKFSPSLMLSYYYERIAYPFLNLFILFLIFPFFIIKVKLTRFFVLSASFFLSFLCYGIYSFSVALTRDGKLPPFLGIWAVHILIFIFYLTSLIKTTHSNLRG